MGRASGLLLPDQPHANLALKYLQYFSVDIPLKKSYVFVKTFYCLRATLGRSEKKRSFLRWVVCPRGRKGRNDVIHLEQRSASQPRQNSENGDLVHEDLNASIQALCDRIIK
jgi:hypothetical protein